MLHLILVLFSPASSNPRVVYTCARSYPQLLARAPYNSRLLLGLNYSILLRLFHMDPSYPGHLFTYHIICSVHPRLLIIRVLPSDPRLLFTHESNPHNPRLRVTFESNPCNPCNPRLISTYESNPCNPRLIFTYEPNPYESNLYNYRMLFSHESNPCNPRLLFTYESNL